MKKENPEKKAPSGQDPYPDLQALRESRGKTLKDISQKTRIRISYLEALESSRFQHLPEPIYSESFIKAYAREIGIGSGEILSRYRAYVRDLADAEDQAKVDEKDHRIPKQHFEFPQWRNLTGAVVRWIKSHLKIMGWSFSILVAFSVFLFLYTDEYSEIDVWRLSAIALTDQLRTEETPTNHPVGLPRGPETVASVAPSLPAPVQPPQEAQAAVPVKEPLTLVIAAREMTWVRIGEDQKPPYQILLRPGDQVERKAEEIISLDVGNAGGIDVQFQGKPLSSLGKRGEVVHLVLPKDANR
jgi:transcriptional regulator with XRE-family HTH domain